MHKRQNMPWTKNVERWNKALLLIGEDFWLHVFDVNENPQLFREPLIILARHK